jgi:hypothetical protein
MIDWSCEFCYVSTSSATRGLACTLYGVKVDKNLNNKYNGIIIIVL